MNTIIFACVHNAGRSQMAAALFNLLADPERARAVSAGTQPAERVHPEVAEAMDELGVDLRAAKPQLLTGELARGSQLLITMGCGESCPVVPGLRRDDWGIPDPKGESPARVREIRDQIRRRVEALVAAEGWQRRREAEKPHVLFVCTHNAARSQMAEAILRRYAGERFEVSSAGFTPTAVHPMTRKVLEEIGIDTAGLRAKGTTGFIGNARLKYAIIVCGKGEPDCPRIFPFTLKTLNWPFDDPTLVEGSPEIQLAKFQSVRDEIDARVRAWLEELDSQEPQKP